MTTNQRKENVTRSQWDLKFKTSKLYKARENASDCVSIGFSFDLVGWKKWRELSGPVTRRGKAKLKPFLITFDTQLKLALKEVLFLQILRENDFWVFAFLIAGCLIEVWLVITNLKQNQYQLKLQHHGHRHRWHHQVNKTNNIKNTNDYSIIIMITIIINSNNKTSLS